MGLLKPPPCPDHARRRPGVPRARWLLAIAIAALAVYWLHAVLGFGGATLDSLFSRWVYVGVVSIAGLACLAQARRSLLWGVFGVGLLAHAIGDVIHSRASNLAAVPTPSVSDLFWLAFCPCAYAALLMLMPGRVSLSLRATRLDGLISGVAAASVLACATVPAADAGGPGGGDPHLGGCRRPLPLQRRRHPVRSARASGR